MAIKVTETKYADGHRLTTEPRYDYVGRVLEVRTALENRNWSDTLDYTDFRTTSCTYALVWLGTHGVPAAAMTRWGEPCSWKAEPARDLEYFEQFIWVDCTCLFVDRGQTIMEPTVDAEMGQGGDPMMWANYLAWQSYQKAAAEKLEAQRAAAAAQREEARKAAAAKHAAFMAKSAAEKATVEAAMLKTPAKGSAVTVDGFTGKVFWKGVKLYRNRWTGTVGVKNVRGEVRWVDVSHWVPELTTPKKSPKKSRR